MTRIPLSALPKWLRYAVVVILATAAIIDAVVDSGPAPPPAPAPAVTPAPAVHDQLRSEIPFGASRAELEAAQDYAERIAASDQLPIVTPDAAPSQAGCVTRLVQNASSRRGVRPRELVAHYTVSRNVSGWGDVNAIVGLFDRPAFAASSNYVIDFEGHCAYIVRESDKAWTQAAANPFAISIEFIAMGNEGGLSPAAIAKGGQVFAAAARRWEITPQLGAVNGCVPEKTGVIDHGMLGTCGGGHHDIAPFDLGPLVRAVKIQTRREDLRCRKLTWWRTHDRPAGEPRRRALERRAWIRSRGLRCEAGGVVPAST